MLISTIDNGSAVKIHPFINQFNHIVVLVKVEGKEYVLDGCQKYTNFSLPPENILGQEGWLLDLRNPKWYKVEAKVLSQSFVVCELKLNEFEELNGKISEIHFGYPEQDLYNEYAGDEHNFWKEYIGEDWKLKDEELTGEDDDKKGLRLTYKLTSSDWAEEAGDLILLDIFKPWRLEKNPFSEEERIFPIDLSYPYIYRKAITLEVPDGYTIESYPQAAAISLPERAISFAMSSQLLNGGKILKVETLFKVQRVYYKSIEVDLLRQIFEQQLIKESEMVVLKKL